MSLSKPASHRVLFNEDYLHMILPYLSTTDLKSARLVTPFWTKIATEFLGRKSFKPIRFSDLTRKDWETLKREIVAFRPEGDPVVKLFQGFHLTWVDVTIVDYCSFLTPFKPSQIIIEGRDVSPIPVSSLTSLLTPILDTLSDLTLKMKWDFLIPEDELDGISNLLQGMRLKRLHLQIWKINERLEYRSKGCVFLNDLLANQAPTLEELHLDLEGNVGNGDDENSRIQFPIFHRLTSLSLKTRYGHQDFERLNNFAPFDFCQKFPNLLSLHFDDSFMCEMFGEFNKDLSKDNILKLTKGHPLKKIRVDFLDVNDINMPEEFFAKLQICFPQVEELTTQSLYDDGSEIPWENTLKNLNISGYFYIFDLVHLEKIETLDYNLQYEDSPFKDTNAFINMLIEHYQELPLLKRLHVSGYNRITRTAEKIVQIQETLPTQFLDILTIKGGSSKYEDTTSDSDSTSDTNTSDSDTD